MNTVSDVIDAALALGSCDRPGEVTDCRDLCRLFFLPQGREFCQAHNFPGLDMFRGMAGKGRRYGIYVDAGKIGVTNPGKIGVIGETEAEIVIDDRSRVHKVILMHGGKARIKASNYAVILLVSADGCEVVMDKDDTVVIL